MPTFSHTLQTSRLLLRPYTIEDVEAAYHMNLDAEISRYTADGGVKSREEIHRIIQEDVLGDYARNGFGRFAVIHKDDGIFIGFAGLKYLPEMDEVDLGYRFLKAYWGMGIATEAGKACMDFGFNTLNLKKIIGIALAENIASIRVLEKLEMSFDKEILYDGIKAQLYVAHASEQRS